MKKNIFIKILYFLILIRFVGNLNNDNYIIIYFNQSCSYPSGFGNQFRNHINYIVNEEKNDHKYESKEELFVNSGFRIEIHFNKTINSLRSFFDGCYDENMKYLLSVNFTNFNSISVSNLEQLFYGCSSLISIDLSNFDTSQVTNMDSMFSRCSSLISINLSNFNTSQVTQIGRMFSGCKSLISLDLSNFDTSKVTNMNMIFYECSSLTSINLSNFDTSQITDMHEMFYGCSSLMYLDLSSFNTTQVTDMRWMFFGCNSLISIDISNFDMINCNSFDIKIDSIGSLKYINLYQFKNDKIISKIFNKTKSHIFVCQKSKIINNPNIYNCCNSNFEPYDCIPSSSEIISSISENIKISDSDNSNNENNKISDSDNSNNENNKISDSDKVIIRILIILIYPI